jgi:hypothetical protein
MRSGSRQKEGERVREEIEALVTAAYQQDEAEDAVLGSRRGDARPAELARREDRLATLEAARRRLEARAKAEAERRASASRRGGGGAPTDRPETPRQRAQACGRCPYGHSAEPLYRPCAA